MKQLFCFLILLPCCLCGQSLFTRITDVNNPVVNFSNTNANYKGASWIDLDHDNYPDLFACQKFLFRNLGDGNFVQLPDVAGVTLGQAASGASWGDVDNDGDLDCISASVVSGLHYNNGDQTFNLQNTLLADFSSYRAWDCALADVDNNGLLDLFFTHAEGFPPGSVSQPCKLYLQTEKDSFVLVTGYEFASEFKPFTIPIWTDFDLDGDMDLLIGSGPGGSPGPDYCYRNMLQETGTFSLVRLTNFPFNQMQDGQVYNAVDYDNDGDMDICLTNYAGAKTRFYRNDDGNYVELSTPFTTTGGRLSNAWGDIDNDGDLDVVISVDGNQNLLFYRNNAGVFAAATILGSADNGICGIVLADYDNDGGLDMYTNGATTARALFHNATATADNQWAAFTLEGKQSNRSAIGALLRVKAIINGQAVWQIREINAHNSFQGQNDLRQHFGLGDATKIDSLELRWPSGLIQKFSELASNNFYKIVEGEDIRLVSTAISEPESIAFMVSPNPVSRAFSIQTGEKIELLQLFDSTGKIMPIKYESSVSGMEVQILGAPAAGTYFLRAYLAHGKAVVRHVMKL